jgi:spore coat protein H
MRRACRAHLSRILCALALTVAPAFAASYRPSVAGHSGDEIFTNHLIRHLELEIDEPFMAALRRHSYRSRESSQRTNVPVTVREGALTWTNVSVHLKGAMGSFRPVDSKPALTLNFDEWVEGQTFHGLEKFSLNNSVQDPSFLSEKISREIYRAAGIPVPRSDYATVSLNGRYLGLYVLVEGWNKQFLKRHFDSVKGNFYDLGGARDLNRPIRASSGANPDDHSMLELVVDSATETDHRVRMKRLRETVDLDRFISLAVLDILMWNWDGYAINRNNYRLFHDRGPNRLVFMPHGLDQMFWKSDGPVVTGRSGLVAKGLFETEEGRDLYLARLRELHGDVFDVHQVTNRIAGLVKRLAPAVMKEGMGQLARFHSATEIFRHRVAARAEDVEAQLAGLRHFARMPPGRPVSLTNWTGSVESGPTVLDRTKTPDALRIAANGAASFGAWTTVVWLEEGRYVIEGRARSRGVRGSVRNERGGAGFRVWSHRKETRGASWGWFPYSNSRDRQLGGLIPVSAGTTEQRLTGSTEWQELRHEFELRQPIADVQVQCVLQATDGEAWFETDSLTIRRLSTTVSKVSSNVRGE